jgi:Flp pilus assembly pilin Flp
MVGLIAVAIILAVTFLGGSLEGLFDEASEAIGGTARPEGE